MRTRDGSQIFGLHENKRWLSNLWFALEKEMALKMLVYMRTTDGSQYVGLHGTRDGYQNVGLH